MPVPGQIERFCLPGSARTAVRNGCAERSKRECRHLARIIAAEIVHVSFLATRWIRRLLTGIERRCRHHRSASRREQQRDGSGCTPREVEIEIEAAVAVRSPARSTGHDGSSGSSMGWSIR
jgi:hypothetical protein